MLLDDGGRGKSELLPVDPACEVEADVVPEPDAEPEFEDNVLILPPLSWAMRSRAISASCKLLRLAFLPKRIGLGPSLLTGPPARDGFIALGLMRRREVDF